MLRAGLQDDSVVAHRLDHVLAFVDREGERLFAVNILLRFGRADIDQRMPMIGRGIDDDVDIVALENLSAIARGERRGAVLGITPGETGGLIFLHIAERNDVAVAEQRRRKERREIWKRFGMDELFPSEEGSVKRNTTKRAGTRVQRFGLDV